MNEVTQTLETQTNAVMQPAAVEVAAATTPVMVVPEVAGAAEGEQSAQPVAAAPEQLAAATPQATEINTHVADAEAEKLRLAKELEDATQRKIDALLQQYPHIGVPVGHGAGRVLIFAAGTTGESTIKNGHGEPLPGTTDEYLVLTSRGFREVVFDHIQVNGTDIQDRYHEVGLSNFHDKLEGLQMDHAGQGQRPPEETERVLAPDNGFFVNSMTGVESIRIDNVFGQGRGRIGEFRVRSEQGPTAILRPCADAAKIKDIVERSKRLPVQPTATAEEIQAQLGLLNDI